MRCQGSGIALEAMSTDRGLLSGKIPINLCNCQLSFLLPDITPGTQTATLRCQIGTPDASLQGRVIFPRDA